MAKRTKAPVIEEYYQGDYEKGFTYDSSAKKWYNKAQFESDAAGWDKFQGDLSSMKENSPLKIELGKTQAPKKATDPTESKADYTKLSTGVSSALGIPTGVQA